MQQSVAVFRNQFLSSVSGMSSEITSDWIPVYGNQVIMSATVINASSITADELVFQLEGSIDASAGTDLGVAGKITTEVFGYNELAAALGSLSYPFVRVKASVGDTTAGQALFDVTLGFSDQ